MASLPRARLYKMVTPPQVKSGITVKIGDKTVAGQTSGMSTLIKATNSLGATANSIAIIVEKMVGTFSQQMKQQISQQQELMDRRTEALEELTTARREEQEDLIRQQNLAADKKAEQLQEGKPAPDVKPEPEKETGGKLNFGFGFLGGLLGFMSKLFAGLVGLSLLKWASKPDNIKKTKKFIEAIGTVGKWLLNTATFMIDMGLGGLMEFMEKPLSFGGVFGILKFATALAVLFAPVSLAKLGIGTVIKQFKSGALVKNLKGMFKGIFGLFRGIIGFISRRPLAAAIAGGALLAWGIKSKMDEDKEERELDDGARKEENNSSVKLPPEVKGKQNSGIMEKGEVTGGNMTKEQIEAQKAYMSLEEDMMQAIEDGDMKRHAQLQKEQDALPKFAGGGWISGPQSGYPVSLDGGKSTSFIGHGTEYVGLPKKAAGGAFVVPFDTPATRTNPGLTNRRMAEATTKGFSVPFSVGGLLPQYKEGGQYKDYWKGKDISHFGQMGYRMGQIMPEHLVVAFSTLKEKTVTKNGEIVEDQSYSHFEDGVASVGTQDMIDHQKDLVQRVQKVPGYENKNFLDILYKRNMMPPQQFVPILNSSDASKQSDDKYFAARKKDREAGLAFPPGTALIDKLSELGIFSGGGKVNIDAVKHRDVGGYINSQESAAESDFNDMSGGSSVNTINLPDKVQSSGNQEVPVAPPIVIPNDYEPPANDFFQTRYGLMADSKASPVEMF